MKSLVYDSKKHSFLLELAKTAEFCGNIWYYPFEVDFDNEILYDYLKQNRFVVFISFTERTDYQITIQNFLRYNIKGKMACQQPFMHDDARLDLISILKGKVPKSSQIAKEDDSK